MGSFKMTQVCFNVTLQSAGRSQCSCRCDVSFSIRSTQDLHLSDATRLAMGQWGNGAMDDLRPKRPPLEPQTMGSVSKGPLVFLLAGSQRRQLKEPPLQQQNGCRLSVLVLCWGGFFSTHQVACWRTKDTLEGTSFQETDSQTEKWLSNLLCDLLLSFFGGGGLASSQQDS